MLRRGLPLILIAPPRNRNDIFGKPIPTRAKLAGERLTQAKNKLAWAKKNKAISAKFRAAARRAYWDDKVARLDAELARAEETADQPRLRDPHLNFTPNYPEGNFFPFEEGTRHYRELKLGR